MGPPLGQKKKYHRKKYFNPYSSKVEDVAGKRDLVCVPDVNILTAAEDLRRSIKPPELIDVGGMKRVKSKRSVYVDPMDRKFRKSTGDLAPSYADLV